MLNNNRLQQISGFVIQMLSSKEYSNPPVCSKTKASLITKEYIPILLKNLKFCKRSLRVIRI